MAKKKKRAKPFEVSIEESIVMSALILLEAEKLAKKNKDADSLVLTSESWLNISKTIYSMQRGAIELDEKIEEQISFGFLGEYDKVDAEEENVEEED